MAYTILIIDDSETIRAVLRRTIGMTGLPVAEIFDAENGLAGLDVLKENWVDIVFTDINMPGMNGIDFFKTVIGAESLKNIPVVIVSTEGSKTRIEELTNLGIAGYLRKPFTPEKIRDIIIAKLGEWNV